MHTRGYDAAKCMESIGAIYNQHLKRPVDAAPYHKRSADLFLRNNNGDRAIEQLERAAKCVVYAAC